MKKLLILPLLLSGVLMFAQRIEISNKGKKGLQLEKHQVNFNLLSPGIKYEIGLFKNVSASTALGLGLASPEGGYSIAPAFNAKAKFYHNIDRRINLGKNVSGNSGDFIAISLNNYFTKWEILGNIDHDGLDLISIGFVYGIQRTYENGMSFEAEIGAGEYRRNVNGIGGGLERVGGGFIFNFSFGWTPKKKKKIKWLNR